MKKRLALITWSGLPHGAASERLMLPYLAAAGIETKIIDWRSAAFDFSQFDLIVLRSCWIITCAAMSLQNGCDAWGK